jgi:hypothetical protein
MRCELKEIKIMSFKVLMAVTMKNAIFWDVTQTLPLDRLQSIAFQISVVLLLLKL